IMDADDVPALSADTLAVLQSFLDEKQEQDERFAQLEARAEEAFQGRSKIDMSV
ncbi:Protein-lysine N-methyltransferase efm5, partial [Coemansia helicoidea]